MRRFAFRAWSLVRSVRVRALPKAQSLRFAKHVPVRDRSGINRDSSLLPGPAEPAAAWARLSRTPVINVKVQGASNRRKIYLFRSRQVSKRVRDYESAERAKVTKPVVI